MPDGSELVVFERVSLDAFGGELLCVTGRSGAGKTTLLSVMSGLLRPTSGHVFWGPRNVWALSEPERAAMRGERVAVVLQDGGLIEWLTAEENVALSLSRTRERRERVQDALRQVELAGRSRHYPRELSMGERERVAIARALVRNPELVIVDEPTAALDRATSEAILDLLTGVARDGGAAVVIASHDPRVVERSDCAYHLFG
jgi:putative ABC transport system ATP-binding protein